MGLSLTERIAFMLRGLPVGRIERAMATAQAEGIQLSANEISLHLLCQRPIEPVVEALILAKREGVPTSWTELCAIDLSSQGKKFDVLSAVQAAAQDRSLTFSSFAPDLKERLVGICRDGSRVQAQCHIFYRLPVSHVFSLKLGLLQERLAARIAVLMSEAASPARLQMSRPEHESSILVLAHSVMPTVQKVELKYDLSS